jgi:hypothetical protein
MFVGMLSGVDRVVGPHCVRWGVLERRMWSFRRYKAFLIHNKQVKTSLGTPGTDSYMV